MAFRGLLRQQSRYFPMTIDLITSVTGTRSWMRSSESGTQIGTLWNANGTRMERKWNANGTQMKRKWNANGTRMERKWNANGTHLRTRSGRVPNAFSVRLFLSSTVYLRTVYFRSTSIIGNFMQTIISHGITTLQKLIHTHATSNIPVSLYLACFFINEALQKCRTELLQFMWCLLRNIRRKIPKILPCIYYYVFIL